MKMIVETVGDFQLVDPQSRDVARAHRPSVVTKTAFTDYKQGEGKLKVLARDLPDEASDEDFAEDLKAAEGDVAFAAESYAASFGPVEVDEKGEPLKGETRTKKTAKK